MTKRLSTASAEMILAGFSETPPLDSANEGGGAGGKDDGSERENGGGGGGKNKQQLLELQGQQQRHSMTDSLTESDEAAPAPASVLSKPNATGRSSRSEEVGGTDNNTASNGITREEGNQRARGVAGSDGAGGGGGGVAREKRASFASTELSVGGMTELRVRDPETDADADGNGDDRDHAMITMGASAGTFGGGGSRGSLFDGGDGAPEEYSSGSGVMMDTLGLQLREYDLDSNIPRDLTDSFPTSRVTGPDDFGGDGNAAWYDVDEEQYNPNDDGDGDGARRREMGASSSSRRFEDRYGNYYEDDGAGSGKKSSSGGGVVGRIGAGLSDMNRLASRHWCVLVLFALMAAAIAVAVVSDVRDAVVELEDEVAQGNVAGAAAAAGRQNATTGAGYYRGGDDAGAVLGIPGDGGEQTPPPPFFAPAKDLLVLPPPPPPSNLEYICSATNNRMGECKIKCSEGECCFAPRWSARSCAGDEETRCGTYTGACRSLEELDADL